MAASGAPDTVVLRVTRVRVAAEPLPLPVYETAAAAGMDLRADVEGAVTLEPGARALIPTGLALEIPPGFEGQVRPRSGLALRHGVTILNAPGTIDADYRGEVQVLLINHGAEAFAVQRGDRIAQLILAPVARAAWQAADALAETSRGPGGFGHTGR
ncbi:MAG: dUTP diphosphatase [bacterium]